MPTTDRTTAALREFWDSRRDLSRKGDLHVLRTLEEWAATGRLEEDDFRFLARYAVPIVPQWDPDSLEVVARPDDLDAELPRRVAGWILYLASTGRYRVGICSVCRRPFVSVRRGAPKSICSNACRQKRFREHG